MTAQQVAEVLTARPIPDAPPADPPATEEALLRLPDLKRLLGVSRTTIYRMIAERRFPKPYLIGVRAVAWRRTEALAWLRELSATKLPAAAPPQIASAH